MILNHFLLLTLSFIRWVVVAKSIYNFLKGVNVFIQKKWRSFTTVLIETVEEGEKIITQYRIYNGR
jgi:hypothetical protein